MVQRLWGALSESKAKDDSSDDDSSSESEGNANNTNFTHDVTIIKLLIKELTSLIEVLEVCKFHAFVFLTILTPWHSLKTGSPSKTVSKSSAR